jgi:glycogen operon protein
MLRAGDEFMHTQAGNNNPYNQDNEVGWIDWGRLRANPDIFRFFQLMIAFRKAHPSLARSRFWREDVRWYELDARPTCPSIPAASALPCVAPRNRTTTCTS